MKRIIRWIVPVLLVLVAIGVTVCSVSQRKRPARTPPPPRVPQVEIAVTQPTEALPTFTTRGVVQARWETDLKAQVAGEVIELSDRLQAGELVEAGEVLVRLDPIDYESRLAEAESRLAQAEFSLVEEQLRGKQARLDWERSGVQADIPDFTARVPHLARATSQKDAALLAVKQAQKDLERTVIRAPYPALVRSRHVSLGSYAQPGAVLATVIGIDQAEVRLPIPPQQAALMEPLDVAVPGWDPTVQLTCDTQGTWTGEIVRIEGVLEQATRNVILVAEVRSPYADTDAPLRLGSFVEAEVKGRPQASLYRIPETALQDRETLWMIDDQSQLQPVGAQWVFSQGADVWVRVPGTPAELHFVARPHSGFAAGMKVEARGAGHMPAAGDKRSSEEKGMSDDE